MRIIKNNHQSSNRFDNEVQVYEFQSERFILNEFQSETIIVIIIIIFIIIIQY